MGLFLIIQLSGTSRLEKKKLSQPFAKQTNRDLASVPRKHQNLSGRFGHDHSKIDTVS